MRKCSGIAVSVVAVSLMTAACGSSGAGEPGGTTDAGQNRGEPAHTWIAGTAVVESVAIARATDFWAECVAERSEGQIEIEVHHGGTLGGDRDIVENVLQGSVQIAVPGQTMVAGWYPGAEVWIFPYLFNDAEHKDRVWDEIQDEYGDAVAAESNLRPLVAIPRAPRMLSSNKVVETPADLVGLKIRVPETPMWVGTFEKLGASPVSMALPEIYSALQTGVIDGQENPVEDSYETGFFEVNTHLALTRHMMQDNVILLNEDVYQSLSDELKDVLRECGDETEVTFRDEVYETEADYIQRAEDDGILVNEVDQEAFREAVEGLEDEFPEIQPWLDRIAEID